MFGHISCIPFVCMHDTSSSRNAEDGANHNHATKELSRERCVRSKKQQTLPEIGFVTGDTKKETF